MLPEAAPTVDSAQLAQAWQVLITAGVPLRLPRAAAPAGFDDGAVCAALGTILAHPTPPHGRERDALVAWLGALRDHFPSRSALVVTLAPAEFDKLRGDMDRGRYVKLRRIALAHLARLV